MDVKEELEAIAELVIQENVKQNVVDEEALKNYEWCLNSRATLELSQHYNCPWQQLKGKELIGFLIRDLHQPSNMLEDINAV